MPSMSQEDAKLVKAQIYDLSERGAKQVLYGMVKILVQNPSVMMVAFRLLVEEGGKYSEALRNRREVVEG
jgi:hypothetical protein